VLGPVEVTGRHANVSLHGADDVAVEEIARLSDGEFFNPDSVDQLDRVYGTLGEQIGYETKDVDASRPWMMLGVVVLLGVASGSLMLGRRLP
jgi:Ca-activated chloride channel homolog